MEQSSFRERERQEVKREFGMEDGAIVFFWKN